MTLSRVEALPSLVELASGVDALYASSSNGPSIALFDFLISLKQDAAQSDSPYAETVLGEQKIHVGRSGWQFYPVLLDHEFGRIGFSMSHHLPGVRLQIYSSFLHAVGPGKALAWFTEFLVALEVPTVWTLGRLDLFMDVQGLNLSVDVRDRFRCRSRALRMHEKTAFTGFDFGSRNSGTVYARIYDKVAEQGIDNLSWIAALWGNRYVSGNKVWRIEFELKTKFLREVKVIFADDGLARVGELWAYSTEEWLTLRDVVQDENRSRWPISAEWASIQQATLRGDALGIDRVRKDESIASLQRLTPGLRGYVSAIGARRGATDLESAIEESFKVLTHDERRSGVTMATRISDKKLKYRL